MMDYHSKMKISNIKREIRNVMVLNSLKFKTHMAAIFVVLAGMQF